MSTIALKTVNNPEIVSIYKKLMIYQIFCIIHVGPLVQLMYSALKASGW